MSEQEKRYFKLYKYNKDPDAKDYEQTVKEICQKLHLNLLHRKERPLFMDIYEIECTQEEYGKVMMRLAEKNTLS